MANTVRIKTRLRLGYFLWFILGSVFALLFLYENNLFLIPLIGVFVLVGIHNFFLKCPQCGKAVLYNPVKVFGRDVNIWTAFPPAKCSKCEFEF